MKWNHLPVAGGIYDQHPQLLDEWAYIFEQKNEHDKREREKEKNASKSGRRR